MKKNKTVSKKTKTFKWFADFSFWWGAFYSVIFVIAVIADPKIMFGDGAFWNTLVTAFFISILPFGAGYFMRKKVKKLIHLEELVNLEKIVLNIAQRNKGFVSAGLVSVKATIPFEQANEAIESLVIKGILLPNVTEEGSIIYKCSDLVNLD